MVSTDLGSPEVGDWEWEAEYRAGCETPSETVRSEEFTAAMIAVGPGSRAARGVRRLYPIMYEVGTSHVGNQSLQYQVRDWECGPP